MNLIRIRALQSMIDLPNGNKWIWKDSPYTIESKSERENWIRYQPRILFVLLSAPSWISHLPLRTYQKRVNMMNKRPSVKKVRFHNLKRSTTKSWKNRVLVRQVILFQCLKLTKIGDPVPSSEPQCRWIWSSHRWSWSSCRVIIGRMFYKGENKSNFSWPTQQPKKTTSSWRTKRNALPISSQFPKD